MRTRWRQVQDFDERREYVVLASSIPPLRRSSTVRLFRGSLVVKAQLERTDGVVGFSLLAQPWQRRYATLSVWTDDAALAAFAAASPHRDLMAALAPEMAPTRFLRWSISGADGAPSWGDALDRLDRPS